MTVYYNDIDPYCCKVLEKNIRAGHLPGGWVDGRDIRTVRATELMGYQHLHLFAGIGAFPLAFERARVPRSLRIITGGFPCTDISNAGRRAGITGPQSGLWSQMVRLLQEMLDRDLGPDYLCIENVAALLGRGLSRVLADLAACGYDAEWRCLRASDFGAPHRRERLFLLAYPAIERLPFPGPARLSQDTTQARARMEPQSERGGMLADAHCLASGLWGRSDGQARAQVGCGGEEGPTTGQSPQSGLGRTFTRIPSWMDGYRWPAGPGAEQYEWEPPRTVSGKQPHRTSRLSALGNTIILPCAEYIARLIVERERHKGNRDDTEEETPD